MEEVKKFLIENNLIERKRVLELLPLYDIYMKNVLEWNKKINITAIRREDLFIRKHFVDSLTILFFNKEIETAEKIIDIGTGGGFPGIPLAILFPEKSFTLVDSVKKKLMVIEESIKEMKLNNIMLLHERVEDLARDPYYREFFDLGLTRAFASLKILSELSLPLIKIGGNLFCYKGPEGYQEMEESRKVIYKIGGEIKEFKKFEEKFVDKEIKKHIIIRIEKVKKSPKEYPRNIKIIKEENNLKK